MKVRILSLHCSSLGGSSALRELTHALGLMPASGCPVRASLTVKVTSASSPAVRPLPASRGFAEKSMRTPSFSKRPEAEAGALAPPAFVLVSAGPPICADAAEAQAASRQRERANALTF